MGLRQTIEIQVQALSLTNWVTLDQLFNFLEFQLPHLENGESNDNKNNVYLSRME